VLPLQAALKAMHDSTTIRMTGFDNIKMYGPGQDPDSHRGEKEPIAHPCLRSIQSCSFARMEFLFVRIL
jgi:hypothetical protein